MGLTGRSDESHILLEFSLPDGVSDQTGDRKTTADGGI